MILRFVLAVSLGLVGCVRHAPSPPLPGSVPSPAPKFEKTFGHIQPLANAGLLLQYKTIALAVDPDAAADQTDYILLTGTGQPRWSPALVSSLRKNMKILSSPDMAASLNRSGFTHVKGVHSGQRMMLKKESAFLFTSVTAGQSYLLEFDNGKNIFVMGNVSDPDSLREFVYGLRDDGREIEIGLFRATVGDDTGLLAKVIGLLQPKNVVLITPSGEKPIDRVTLHEALQSEFYEGPVVSASRETIPF